MPSPLHETRAENYGSCIACGAEYNNQDSMHVRLVEGIGH